MSVSPARSRARRSLIVAAGLDPARPADHQRDMSATVQQGAFTSKQRFAVVAHENDNRVVGSVSHQEQGSEGYLYFASTTGDKIIGADFGLRGVMDLVRQVAPVLQAQRAGRHAVTGMVILLRELDHRVVMPHPGQME